jgi:ABC-type amino acid transport substrate-binding protein
VVGISGDQPPLNATTKEGRIIGLDADLANSIASNLDVKVRYSQMFIENSMVEWSVIN